MISFFCVRFLQLFSIVSATVGPTVHVRLKQTQILRRNQKICCDDLRCDIFYFVPLPSTFFNVSATVGQLCMLG
jgi:hypothetical protein